MIGRLTGNLLEIGPGEVLLDVGGVGYSVQIPLSTYYKVSRSKGVCTLQIHTHVREEALQLFGFALAAERELFRRLIGVSGVGPKLALAILSGIGVEEFQQTVLQRDRDRLQRIPGVGKKTAERLLLEMKDKGAIGSDAVSEIAALTGEEPEELDPAAARLRDGISALMNLGYSAEAARKAIAKAGKDLGDGDGLEGLLRAALTHLVR